MMHEKKVKEFMKRMWNDRAGTFDNSPGHGIHCDEEKQAWIDILTKAFGRTHGLKVLDIGTGTGVIALVLAEMGNQVTGIDISERMLERAEEKAEKNNLPVEFRVGDAEVPPFGDESFDVVVSRHLLWTLPNPEKAIAEWKRVLRPGGKIVTIDGDWTRHKTLSKKIWRLLAMPLIVVTEQRDPRLRYKKMEKHLPMRQRKRPEADVALFQNLGLEVNVTKVDIPRNYTVLNYLKYGYSGHSKHQFVVQGIKSA
jgi:ubiquinone/menaquinone biosynthesis C-methylase UbiE